MRINVKVLEGENHWKVFDLESERYLESIEISLGKKWSPLLHKAMAKNWNVREYENLKGKTYQWSAKNHRWISKETHQVETFSYQGGNIHVMVALN